MNHFVLFFIFVTIIATANSNAACSIDTCQLITKLKDQESSDLEKSNKAREELKKLFVTLGADVQVGLKSPNEVSSILYQKLIYDVIFEKLQSLDSKLENLRALIEYPSRKPFDCLDVLLFDIGTKSGPYTVYPQGLATKVYCDLETDGGGWTVFLLRQRQKLQENFARNWNEYKDGFGNPPNEYWMGNEALHLMTSGGRDYSLRTEAESSLGGKYHTASPLNIWGEWSTFKVESEEFMYRVNISGYDTSSTMLDGRGYGYNNGQFFTTMDQDNDNNSEENCAADSGLGGGFWYDSCFQICPTRVYGRIHFYDWSTTDSAERHAETLQMKIRPRK